MPQLVMSDASEAERLFDAVTDWLAAELPAARGSDREASVLE